ncbi:coproporphyrinogen III oxidase [Leptolyngbyaceae cyanobacterium CCMR0082]|uniref:Coproporphyrinogen III oxidase n=1 Tax=Adonisia turfae CCMR0082 TaxID=2304604 RepID=A0A6M0RYQ8_9CYAN|nr:coproporphyrinogen III oxidase [Adonisia turfae CCMR0082]
MQMSLLPFTHWQYGYGPTPETPEAELSSLLLKSQDWVGWVSTS